MANARQRAARRKARPQTLGSESGALQGSKKVNEQDHRAENSKSGKKKRSKDQKKRKRDEVEGEVVGIDDNGEAVQSGLYGAEKVESGVDSKEKDQEVKRAKVDQGSKKPGKKHPLRVAGMRPGEACFLCKGNDHMAKNCPTKAAADRKKMCLLCRKMGHTVKTCPSNFGSEEGNVQFCYNCGEHGHRLSHCKLPLKDGGTTYAECFVCKQKGHLSKNCPNNSHGIYPNGGCCKLCGGVTHLAKDCPSKTAGHREKLKISIEAAKPSELGESGKRIVFHQSGDDLNDDFGDIDYGSDGYVADDQGDKKVPGKSKKNPKRETLKVPKLVKFQRA